MPHKVLESAAFEAPRVERPVPLPTGLEVHRLLDSLPAGAYTCDTEGRITWFNQHVARVWGPHARAPRLVREVLRLLQALHEGRRAAHARRVLDGRSRSGTMPNTSARRSSSSGPTGSVSRCSRTRARSTTRTGSSSAR